MARHGQVRADLQAARRIGFVPKPSCGRRRDDADACCTAGVDADPLAAVTSDAEGDPAAGVGADGFEALEAVCCASMARW